MGEANSTTASLIKTKPKTKERKQCRFVASVTALCFRRSKKPHQNKASQIHLKFGMQPKYSVCHLSETIYCAHIYQSMFFFAKFLFHKWIFLSWKLFNIVSIFFQIDSFSLIGIPLLSSVFVFAIKGH